MRCGVIYTIMKPKNISTNNNLFELGFIFCGKTNEIEVREDCDSEVMELLVSIAHKQSYYIKMIKNNPLCPKCHKLLSNNGTQSIKLNKTVLVKYQKYIHRNCKNSSCIASLENIKDKWCCYMRSIREKGTTMSLIQYSSYQSKKEYIYDQYSVNIPRSTVYYHENTESNTLTEYLESQQYKRIKEMYIIPSGIYSYDEQYVFVNKKFYMRLTLIDHVKKLIMHEQIVSKEEFNDKTIQNFLKTAINSQPLKAIITDGRKSYKTIIEATGAIHHRCYFHIMQNLMTPLQKHINKLERSNKKLQNDIEEKNQSIVNIQENKKKYKGRIPLKDNKTHKQNQKIKKLTKEIRDNKKAIRENNKELTQIQKDKERIQKIFTSKTHKQAKQRFNTIYNRREHINTIIKKFLEKIQPELDILLNHTIDHEIPKTNNTVENYYKTTLPRCQKRIYRTLKGLKRRIKQEQIRWTHKNIIKDIDNINKHTYD